MDRVILHCDLNNFFASVEIVLDPSLKDQYIAVCGDPTLRHGIVLAKNEKAKKCGVRTAEAIWEAKAKCPQLICVAPHHEEYARFSNIVRGIYSKYTDKIEPFGIDECWLDVTNSQLFGDGQQIADLLRKEVMQTTGLTISVGVSFNKIYAKLGSDIKKPDATTVISRLNYKQLIYNLPANQLLMVGRKTYEKLVTLNIFTIGQLANADIKLLTSHFGIIGKQLQQYASGNDCSEVISTMSQDTIKSVGHGTTTIKDMTTYEEAKSTIYLLSEMICTRLRRYKVLCKTVSVDLRFNNLQHISMQMPLFAATTICDHIAEASLKLLENNWKPTIDLPIRSLTISTSKLIKATDSIQEDLLYQTRQKDENLQNTIDKIRNKYGYGAVTRGVLVKTDFIVDKFCGEDDLLPFKRGKHN